MANGGRTKSKSSRKRKGKIKISSSARIVEKNDATRVAKPDTANYPRMQARPPADVGVTFRVKIKRK